ncbi:hypothetical protein Tco_0103720 [Tanacetum coccineum]
MLLDEANMKKGDKLDSVPKKRDRGDDQDEDPSAGSNQGKKTKKIRCDESESSKKTSTTKESSKDDVEQTVDDVGQPPHNDVDETQADAASKIPKKDWFQNAPRPEILNPDWNTLMSTHIDFSAFFINCLKLRKITRADLVGPVFNLLKDQLDWGKSRHEGHKILVDMSKPLPLQDKEGNKERSYSSSIIKTSVARYTLEGIEDMIPTLWSLVIIAYDKDAALGISYWGPQCQQFYKAMINTVSKHKVFLTIRILSVVSVQLEKRSGYGYLKEIVVRQADQKLYKFKEGDFPDLHLNDIKDMLLLIAQNKLFNLDGDNSEEFRSAGWWQKNRDGQTTDAKDSMTSQIQRDLPRDIPLDSVEVLRYDTKGVKVRMGNNAD